MNTLSINNARQWLKTSDNQFAQFILKSVKSARCLELPVPRLVFSVIYLAHKFLINFITTLSRILYWTPLFKTKVLQSGKRLYLYGGMPYITGPLSINYGDDCRISGKTTFSARGLSNPNPELHIGNNVDIGWMSTIAVGSKICIGNNVRIASQAFFAGYPGHPVNAYDRAQGLPDTENQIGDIVIKDDVWIATGVSIMSGVTVGERSIIAAGSVVTRDIPADVLAGGNPAKVIKRLNTGGQ